MPPPEHEYRIKVLDFGLNKRLWGGRTTSCQPLTMAGESVGTQGYLASEMLNDMGITTPQVRSLVTGTRWFTALRRINDTLCHGRAHG